MIISDILNLIQISLHFSNASFVFIKLKICKLFAINFTSWSILYIYTCYVILIILIKFNFNTKL